ncbi:hypothetical protein PVAND_004175 [Polypedilum vanderplanki]|uniref:Uncharacterized protein n=1 Tax=Polypedilum vanderplanki TaxID=319348 RepID=A0A9J6BW77_POLVA|nr:hypothetical protein PVAND_004175 [Polypedilum vanderplanki]
MNNRSKNSDRRNNSTIAVKNQQVDSNLKYASNVSMDFGNDSVKEDDKSSKIKPIIVDSGIAPSYTQKTAVKCSFVCEHVTAHRFHFFVKILEYS